MQALELLAQNYTFYRGFDRELKAEPAIALAYISAYGGGFPDLPSDLQQHASFAIAALRQNPHAISKLSLAALKDPAVRAVALQQGQTEDSLAQCQREKELKAGFAPIASHRR